MNFNQMISIIDKTTGSKSPLCIIKEDEGADFITTFLNNNEFFSKSYEAVYDPIIVSEFREEHSQKFFITGRTYRHGETDVDEVYPIGTVYNRRDTDEVLNILSVYNHNKLFDTREEFETFEV